MGTFSTDSADVVTPSMEEVAEAKHYPNAWLYRIAGDFLPSEDVPPQAIIGAWQVDANGCIVGEFKKNPNYDGVKFPAKSRNS